MKRFGRSPGSYTMLFREMNPIIDWIRTGLACLKKKILNLCIRIRLINMEISRNTHVLMLVAQWTPADSYAAKVKSRMFLLRN